MSNNPYQSPASDLSTPQQALPARPLAIKLACGVFGLASLAGFATLIPGYGTDWEKEPLYIVYILISVYILASGITIWLMHAIFNGKNWARWAMLGLSVLGALMLFMPTEEPTPSKLIETIEIISTLSYLPGCAVLFLGKGGRWFAEMKAGGT
jgi:hypothetical protein